MNMPVRVETVSSAYPPYVMDHDSAVQAMGRDAIEKIVNRGAEEPLDTETVDALGIALAVDAYARERDYRYVALQQPRSDSTPVRTNSYGPWSPQRTLVYAAALLSSVGMHFGPGVPLYDYATSVPSSIGSVMQDKFRCGIGMAFGFTENNVIDCVLPSSDDPGGARLLEEEQTREEFGIQKYGRYTQYGGRELSMEEYDQLVHYGYPSSEDLGEQFDDPWMTPNEPSDYDGVSKNDENYEQPR